MTRSAPHHAVRPSAALLLALLPLAASLFLPPVPAAAKGPPEAVRFATFNASLNRNEPGQALTDLSKPAGAPEPDPAVRARRAQAAAVAEIIQRTRPEVLLINEFDYVDGPVTGNALTDAFQANYLGVSQNGQPTIHYDYVFVAPSNTGIASGFDLNNNGATVTTPLAPGYGDDALGFGEFPGKFGMAVFSQHPIDYGAARTFQHFKWKDMPGALLPDDASKPAPADWYSAAELAILPLSSKSHWDVPISIGGTTVHFLVSHPTPPVFDGAEDRNGRRNFDEIRLWADYVSPGAGRYIYDDAGATGGLKPGAKFVIAGDQNSDPLDGDSIPGSIQQLLDNPRINTTVTPSSVGGTAWAAVQGGVNANHRSDPAFDTADFCDTATPPPCSGPGNLRADYVLPSRNLKIVDAAVFWPEPGHPLVYLTGTGFPVPSSDHRLVWVDLKVPGSARGK
ncbi:MAG: endonuclease/exonuclease/phosphatase family protein [Chloroflexi bacterium]|nr:endonuclease/exonuclease/phosphatase family protein [Chloroflexota bacterium]